MPGGPPRRPPLHDRQARLGARFIPFAGWEMPVHYTGIVAEHEAVRGQAGLFDVSHMGRVWLRGPRAGAQLRAVSSYDILRLRPGRAHYSLYCNDAGGIDDDVFIYRVDPERWLVVHNAANAEPGFARLRAAASDAAEEVTAETIMLAVQGPAARERLAAILGPAVLALEPRHCAELPWRDGQVVVGRTGYTGEDGTECVLDVERGGALWDALCAQGVTPAGLGARDTLRLEAALPLHGNDIDPTTHPYEAGLGWVVSLHDERPFTGREALLRLEAQPITRRLSHLRARGRGVPRPGYSVRDPDTDSAAPAILTSGGHSPTLRTGIGMAYLPLSLAEIGTRLHVDVRGRTLPMEVVPRPFYRRATA